MAPPREYPPNEITLAPMNRIEWAIISIQMTRENSDAAMSRIVDANHAAESVRSAQASNNAASLNPCFSLGLLKT